MLQFLKPTSNSWILKNYSLIACAASLLMLAVPKPACAGIIYTASDSASAPNTLVGNQIGTYDSSTGASINPVFITGLNFVYSFTLDGTGNLYVTNANSGTVGKYNATTGA